MVTQVLFEGRRAVGVSYTRKDGTVQTATVIKEVILSLGALRSPQLLMLSGIGPSDVLAKFGIPIVAESRGVGRNLQDHLMTFAMASVPPHASQTNSTYAPSGGFFFSSWCKQQKCRHPDMEWMCGRWNVTNHHGFDCAIALVGHIQSSPGFLTLKSNDPSQYPAIFPNYLGAPADLNRFVDGIKQTCNAFAQDPQMFHPPPASVSPPICWQNVTDQDLAEFVMSTATTVYHPVGTCKMGPISDLLAVVGDTLKVHGVQGLRVADASIMPVIPNVNTDAPSRMIGYHLADMILEEAARGDMLVSEDAVLV